eukprot:SAG31_NODE_27324_length_427_cov_9.420732_1_plen_33_part_10
MVQLYRYMYRYRRLHLINDYDTAVSGYGCFQAV